VRAEESPELTETDPDEKLLRDLARATGGGFYRPEDARKLLIEVKAEEKVEMERRESSIWDQPWLFLLFFGLIAAEWLVRKWRALD